MIEAHPTQQELEAFVGGRLAASPAFQRHVSRCAQCAARLQREATVEVTLRAVGAARARRGPVFRLRTGGFQRRTYLMGAAIAVAASMLFFFHGVRAMAVPPTPRPPVALGAVPIADGGADARLASNDGGRFGRAGRAPFSPGDDFGSHD